MDIPLILSEYYKGQEWTLNGDDYEGLIWYDERNTLPKPTLEELTEKWNGHLAAQPFKYFRQERNRRLADVDWVFSADYQIDDESYQQWLTYRKALRDLPSLTEDPENPVWPEQPVMPSGNTTNLSKRQEHLVNENIAMKGKITRLERKTTDQELELIQLKRRLNKLERPT